MRLALFLTFDIQFSLPYLVFYYAILALAKLENASVSLVGLSNEVRSLIFFIPYLTIFLLGGSGGAYYSLKCGVILSPLLLSVILTPIWPS